MIYTLTMNPAVDYKLTLDSFSEGKTNRTVSEEFVVGGKGINVSRVLSILGTDSTILGFIAGFTGEYIVRQLRKEGLCEDLLLLENGVSRVNVKIMSGKESEINASGPVISENDFQKLLDKTAMLSDGDTIILAGSAGNGMAEDTYERIIKQAENKKICAVVDAAGGLLTRTLTCRPFLIKPNRQELSELFQTEISSIDDVIHYGKKLVTKGAKNVLISLGGDGAVLLAENGEILRTDAVSGKVRSTVGCGDSMVAGFVAGFRRTEDYGYALRLGTACAAAAAFSEGTVKREDIDKLLPQIMVSRIQEK